MSSPEPVKQLILNSGVVAVIVVVATAVGFRNCSICENSNKTVLFVYLHHISVECFILIPVISSTVVYWFDDSSSNADIESPINKTTIEIQPFHVFAATNSNKCTSQIIETLFDSQIRWRVHCRMISHFSSLYDHEYFIIFQCKNQQRKYPRLFQHRLQ